MVLESQRKVEYGSYQGVNEKCKGRCIREHIAIVPPAGEPPNSIKYGLAAKGRPSGHRRCDPAVKKIVPNLGVDVNHSGKQESQRFPGPSRGDPHHVPSQEGHGPALALNGCWRAEALLHDLLEYVLGHGCLFEGHGRFGNAVAHDDDAAVVAPLDGLLVRPCRYVRVFDIKVLRGETYP